MQKFCHNCGKQLVVGAKFCNECGTSLSSLSNQPATPDPNKQFTPVMVGRGEDDEDGDSYIDRMSHINIRQDALHVEIIKDRPLGESVGSLISQAMHAGRAPEVEASRAAPVTDSKSFLEDFKREAGTMRNEARQPTT